MNKYFLDNYHLSIKQKLRSFVLSEYGKKHLKKAKENPKTKWGHRLIGLIELTPFIGVIASISEAIFAKLYLYTVCKISDGKHPKKIHNVKSTDKPTIPDDIPDNPYKISHLHLFIPPNRNKAIKDVTTVLFYGKQKGCNNKVDVQKAKQICTKLNNQSESDIRFNKDTVVKDLIGGTCSPMSFKFSKNYFKKRKVFRVEPDQRSIELIDQIMGIGKKFEKSSEKMRNLQAAFNSIEVIKPKDKLDHEKNKIQALANYYGLTIHSASEEVDLLRMKRKKKIPHFLKTLPDGHYFVRTTLPKKNHKLEEYGHSMVYIKEKGVHIFYDPNMGAYRLASKEAPNEICSILLKNYRDFKVEKSRFYRMQPNF